MDTLKTKGIVISSVAQKDKDMLVSIFTPQQGIITAKLRSVKSENAKLKFAKEIFCFGEFLISLPSNIITSVEVTDSFFDVTKDISKYYLACGVLTVVKAVLPAGEVSPGLFVETLKAIGSICYDDVDPKYPFCKFLLEIFENMGYSLSLDKCSSCSEKFTNKRFLNLDFGEIVCVGCSAPNSIEISKKCHSAFRILKNSNYDNLGTISFAQGSIEECLNILTKNFEHRFNKKITLL